MELRHYLTFLRRWLWLILLGGALAGGSSYLVSNSMTRVYEASTTLLVNQAQNPGVVAYNDVLTSERLTKTYGELIRKRPVLEDALAELKLPISPEQLNTVLSVRVVRDTMLLELKAESTDPQQAADIANAVARAFITESRLAQTGQAALSRDALREQLQTLEANIRTTSTQIDELRSATQGLTPEARQAEIGRLQNALTQYQLTYSQMLKSEQDMQLAEARAYSSVSVAEPAVVNPVPVRPKVAQNVLLAALVGLMLATGVVLLIEYLDDTVKTGEDVAKALGVPALGYVMRLGRKDARALTSMTAMGNSSPVAESFRVLRTNLQFSLLDRPGRTILVTSAGKGEGKTTSAINLALVMAEAGKQVILVDADLRRPSLHRYFQLENSVGLTTALLDLSALDPDAVRPTGIEGLMVLTSGPMPPNPSELLGTPRMAGLVDLLKSRADVVLFDGPPMLVVTDPAVMAPLMDGVLVVVDTGSTRGGTLLWVRETLERATGSGKLLGAILNKLTPQSSDYQYRYYYHQYYGHHENGRNGRRGKDGLSPKGSEAGRTRA